MRPGDAGAAAGSTPASVPLLTATKVDSLQVDNNNNGKADPGDTLRYTIEIRNSGTTTATRVQFDDTPDVNTTIVPGSLRVAPLAVDDHYANAIGNTRFSVPAGAGLLANDFDPDGSVITIFSFDATSSLGGSVAVTTSGPGAGAFTYDPPAGITGVSDSFGYTISDGDATASATAVITLSEMIWYVDDTAPAGGDGRSFSPFYSLTPINGPGGAGDPDGSGDHIFVYEGSGAYPGGIELEDGQKLIGQGVPLVVAGQTLVPAAGKPTITNDVGHGVRLASGNTVRGLVAETTLASSAAIAGTGVGGFTADALQATGNPGAAIDIQGAGTLAATFESLTSNSGTPGARITGAAGGSVGVTGATIVSAASGDGIVLESNAGIFSFDQVSITTSSGRGLVASGNGTVNVAGGSVAATGGAALDVQSTALGLTFSSLTSINSSAEGLVLNSAAGSLASGTTTVFNPAGTGISITSSAAGASFTFGNTSASGSGGTGVRLDNNAGDVGFGSLSIAPYGDQRGLFATNNAATSGNLTATSGTVATTNATAIEIWRDFPSGTMNLGINLTSVLAIGGTSGIVLKNTTGSFMVSGDGTGNRNGSGGAIADTSSHAVVLEGARGVTLRSMNIQNPAGNGVDASSGGSANLTLAGVGIDLSGVSGPAEAGHNGFTARNLSGSNFITNSLIRGINIGNNSAVHVSNLDTHLTLFEIRDSTFQDSFSGQSNVLVEQSGTSNMRFDVFGSVFERLFAQAVQAAAGQTSGSTGMLTTNIGGPALGEGNTFRSAAPNGENNVGAVVTHGATHGVRIEKNLFEDVAQDGSVSGTSVISTQNNGGHWTGSVRGNTIRYDAASPGGRRGIGHVNEPPTGAPGTSDLTIDNNTIDQLPAREAIFVDFREHAGNSNLRITNNKVGRAGGQIGGTRQAIEIRTRGERKTVNVLIDNNEVTATTSSRLLDIDSEDSSVVNATVLNNTLSNQGSGTSYIDVATEDAASEMCANISGNALLGAFAEIRLNRQAGILDVTQASAAALASLNPGATVNSFGSPNFDQPACALPPAVLHALGGEGAGGATEQDLTRAALAGIVGEAILRWDFAGISADERSRLLDAAFEVADLPEGHLGHAEAGRILLDRNGAGHGWFVDETPYNSWEYEIAGPDNALVAPETSPAHGRIDLLTAVLHLCGLLIGQHSASHEGAGGTLMDSMLPEGVRRLPARTVTLPPGSVGPRDGDAPEADADAAEPDDGALSEGADAAAPAGALLSRPMLPSAVAFSTLSLLGAPVADPVPVGGSPGMGSPRSSAPPAGAEAGGRSDVILVGPFDLPPATSVTITFDVTINTPVPTFVTSVANQGLVVATNTSDVLTDDPDVGGASDPTVTPLARADLQVSKDDAQDPVFAGEDLLYFISFQNNGPDAAVNVRVSDAVPAGTTFVAATAPAGWNLSTPAVGATGDVVFSKATVASGESASFDLTVRVDPAAADGSVITNTVLVTSDTPEGSPGDEIFLESTTVLAQADLAVTKSDSPDPVTAGGVITYTIDLMNNGAGSAMNVALADSVPPDTTFVSAAVTSGSGWSIVTPSVGATGVVVFSKPVVANSETAQFQMVVAVDASVTGGSTISNVADASSSTPDPSVGNNSASADTLVNVPPSIACPAPVQANTTTGICSAQVSYPAPTASGFPAPRVVCTPSSGSSFSLGESTVQCTASNGVSPDATCSFTVTVVDNEPPAIICPGAVTFGTDPGLCSASVNFSAPTVTDNCPGVGTPACLPPSGSTFPLGATDVNCSVSDAAGHTSSCATSVTVADTEPPAISGASASPAALWPPNHRMREVTVSYTAADNCSAPVNCALSVASSEPVDGTGDGDTAPDWEVVNAGLVRLRSERAGNGNGRIYTVTITCTDGVGASSSTSVEVHVAHNITGPISGTAFRINSPVTFTGTFWDVPGRTHTARWVFDGTATAPATVVEPSGSRVGTVRGTHTFTAPGVYKVRLEITDNTGATSYVTTQGDLEAIVVIFDPGAGYTIGGGWIASPPGALAANPALAGKLGFGFTSKYFKNATNPKGETQIEFLIGELEFNALNFDYLVISGAKAQFRGFGKINGAAGYDFILTVLDGDVRGAGGIDKFRLKIWQKTTGVVVYDSQMGASDAADPTTPVGSGSSVIIKK